MKHEVFSYESEKCIKKDIDCLGLDLPFSEESNLLFTPDTLGFGIKNRFLSQPIEGFDSNPDGSPSERSIQRYIRLSKNELGSIWFESISVSEDGRSNPYQLWITECNLPSFKEMVESVKAASSGNPPFLVAQLTHSGRYSKPTPICAFENPLIPKDNAIYATDEYLEKLEDWYVDSALLAEKAGFDAVDIRACHGYLINELFSAYNRKGKYGGSFENRTRLIINIVKKLKKVSSIKIAVRLNMFDGLPYPYGWGSDKNNPLIPDTTEPMKLLHKLYNEGVCIFNISSGIGAVTPFVIRPYDRGGMECPEHPLEGVYRMLDLARKVKKEFPDVLVCGSALSWLREFAPNIASACIKDGWFDLAGFGRQCIAYPEFVRDLANEGHMERSKCCSTCCGCTNLIKVTSSKLRCVMQSE